MLLTTDQIKAILSDSELAKLIRSNLDDLACSHLLSTPLGDLSEEEFTALSNEVFEVWSANSKVVKEYLAQQDKGPYPIAIMGLEGAYFVVASEYPNSDCFESLSDAEAYVERNFGKYLVR